MITPVTSTHAGNLQQISTPQARVPEAPVQKSGTLSKDQVTLKSAGDVDHDGDSK
jgi:hypothetical protein